MTARFRGWSVPTSGTAFLFDVEAIARRGELWRQLDRALLESLRAVDAAPSLGPHGPGAGAGPYRSPALAEPEEARLELWGGLAPGSGHLLVLLAEVGPADPVSRDLYERVAARLPPASILFAGTPLHLPELWPLYAAAEGQVFRCAVSVAGAPPALRVLVRRPEGLLFSAVSPAPVNLSALVDKLDGVNILVAELEGGRGERLNEEGDRVDSRDGASEPPTVLVPPEEPPKGTVPSPTPFTPLDQPPSPLPFSVDTVSIPGSVLVSESLLGLNTADSLGVRSLEVSDADVIAVEVVEAGVVEVSEDAVLAEMVAAPHVALPPLPVEVSLPGPSSGGGVLLARFGGANAESTLVDVGEEDIERVVHAAPEPSVPPLASLSDVELRLILTAPPLREQCERLSQALGRTPGEVARIFALASGSEPRSEIERAFAARVYAVSRAVGWVLGPGE